MKQRIIIATFALLLSFSAYSGPARRGTVCLTQPDGTTFNARIRGDEFMKIYTTEAGAPIIQDNEGWWNYAYYGPEGGRISSGHRIGSKISTSGIRESHNIPYARLASDARRKRGSVIPESKPILARVMENEGTCTRSGASKTMEKHGLIILAQFKDIKFTYTKEDFVKMLTQPGYSHNGATGSAKEYFDAQFNGLFNFSFDVSGIVTLPGTMAAYGSNDSQGADIAPEKMIIDACNLADREIDFSIYDDDGDGMVDNVFVFFAGGDEAEGAGEDRIWSHAWYLYEGAHENLILDGKRINRYACTSELSRRYTTASSYRDVLAGIGTFCHEYFHTFGMPDMYDTDYEESGGTAASLWSSTSLMDTGNQNNYGNTPPYLNAIEREMLGVSKPKIIVGNGGYTLQPISVNGEYYRLNTDHEDEYYLIECRSEEGWDKHAGGNGMLVYHIDKSGRNTGYSDSYGVATTAADKWYTFNEVNSRPDHQCADLIEADARQDGFSATEDDSYYMSQNNIRGIFFPSSTVNSLLPGSRPGLKFWSGAQSEISITNIRRTNEGVAFNVLGFSDDELPPSPIITRTEVFMDAAIIQFKSDRIFEGEASFTWGRTGAENENISIKPYTPGEYAITLEGLQPDNKTYTAKISFELGGVVGEEETVSFMTKKSPSVKWPFIYMNGIARNSDGTLPKGCGLPLRVYNAGSAAEITWEFNGAEIATGGTGYYTVEESGTLKVHIIWKDGSEEIIMKEIIIGEEEK